VAGAFDWPPALEGVHRSFAAAGNRPPSPEMIDQAFHTLSPGSQSPAQPTLFELLDGWPAPTWFQLEEVALGSARPLLTAKLVGALTGLAAGDSPGLLINIGANGGGDVGMAIGLPPSGAAGERWSSGLATEMIFSPGGPFGWSALAASPYDCALVGSTTTAGEASKESGDPLPTVLEMLLGTGGSSSPWSVDIVVRPLPDATPEMLRGRVNELMVQSARSVGRTDSRTESESATYTNVRAENVLASLKQWQTLADDCLRVGGWTGSVRVRASTAGDLAAISGAFRGAHGDLVHVTHPTRRQAWNVAAPTGPVAEAATWLSSHEIADVMIFSGASVGRIQARRPLASGRQSRTGSRPIDLGCWLGSSVPARIDVTDLSAHGFISGITGSGKSTTTRTLLSQLWNRHQVPFLVIDPAKTDYADFGRHLSSDLRVIQGRDITMNVLRAWPGCDPGQHIARVGTAFRGSFAMPSPVPYVVSILLEELAQEASYSEVTLHDAWSRLDSLIEELHYRGEIEDNIKASLGLRLRLLLQPSRADRVACLGAVQGWLTERPTIVQLGDVADEEERNFLASMLVLYVSDAARVRGLSETVRHVTVVEEAHRLMPEPVAVGPEDADAGAVSAKLMAQLLAEIRAYGEGLLIIDQSPAAVAREVLRNTNVKLVHRIVDRDDQRALGGALGLDEEASSMLGSLQVGRLLVSTRHLVQPQAAQVSEDLEEFVHDAAPSQTPDSAYVCHNASRAAAHHVAERHGSAMEQIVALWTLGLGDDLRRQAQRVVQQDPSLSASCLIYVGLRRYVRTLKRIGYVTAEEVSAYQSRLWAAAIGGAAAELPIRRDAAPFAGCVLCQHQCVARGAVSVRGLSGYRRAQHSLLRSSDADEGLRIIVDAMTTIGDEIGTGELADPVALCAGIHLAHEGNLSNRLMTELTQPRTS
jgi:Helicase HerA, central domain